MTIKTIFLDRDGVINKEVNYLHKISDFEFIDGIFNACHYFQVKGFQIIIISNQSGISRGFYSINDYLKLNDWMLKQFKHHDIKILDSFYCPHIPNFNCNCRKPKPGMLLEANNNHSIDFGNSWIIGDKETDIQAGNASGIKNTILVRSGHKIDESNSKASYIIDSIHDSLDIIT